MGPSESHQCPPGESESAQDIPGLVSRAAQGPAAGGAAALPQQRPHRCGHVSPAQHPPLKQPWSLRPSWASWLVRGLAGTAPWRFGL